MAKDSLLADIDSKSVNQLIEWEKFKIAGGRIFYILDPHIISRYCFPNGVNFREAAVKLTQEYIYDEQLTLYNLFNIESRQTKFFIPVEYIGEIRKILADCKQNNKKARFRAENFLSQIDERLDIEFLKENFSNELGNIIIKESSINKFESILNNDSIIFDEEEILEQNIKNYFKFNDIDSDTKDIIDKYNEIDRDIYFSRIADSLAIRKCFNINAKSNKDKILFLFLSNNGPTSYVFKSFNKESLNCTLSMFLAQLICREFESENSKVNSTKTIQNLRFFKSKLEVLEQDKNNYKKNMQSYIELFTNYKSMRNQFENLGFYKNMKYSVVNINSNSNSILDDTIQQLISKLVEKIQFEENVSLVMDAMIKEILLNNSYASFIESIDKNKGTIKITLGKDLIESKFQVMPIFLMLSTSNYYKEYQLLIYHILSLILGNKKSYLTNKKIYELVIKLKEINQNSKDINLILVKLFILMLIPIKSFESNDGNEELLLDWINHIKFKRLSDFNKNEQIEFHYLAIWIFRRLKKYRDADEHIKLGFELTKYDDPRFYHGAFLNDYCKYKRSADCERNIRILKTLTSKCESALFGYHEYFLKIFDEIDYRNIYERYKELFFNNLSYFFALISEEYYISKDINSGKEYAIVAREKLENLKSLLLKSSRNKLIEYSGTESYLEFVESFYLNDDKKFKKLLNARREISSALEKMSHREQITRYKDIKQRIETEWYKNHLILYYGINIDENYDSIQTGIEAKNKSIGIMDYNKEFCDIVKKNKLISQEIANHIEKVTGIPILV